MTTHNVKPNPYHYYRHADLFVLSSVVENFANVIVEAMACGCPVVSTDCPHGPADILKENQYGRLVPMNDPEALATAMSEMLKAPTPTAKLLDRANDFTVDHIAQQYLDAANKI